MKALLLSISTILSFIMYVPQFRRIMRRKTTGDFSKGFYWMVLALQMNNGLLAAAEGAWYLFGMYVLHIFLVGGTIWLVHKYYD